jgi:hypothetical protein
LVHVGGSETPALRDPIATLEEMAHWLQPLGPVWTKGPSKEAKARGKKAVEAYGDRSWQHEACIVPAAFLEVVGFRVRREHPRFPLYRFDLGSLAKHRKNVEAAVEAFLESVFAAEPVPQKVSP